MLNRDDCCCVSYQEPLPHVSVVYLYSSSVVNHHESSPQEDSKRQKSGTQSYSSVGSPVSSSFSSPSFPDMGKIWPVLS